MSSGAAECMHGALLKCEKTKTTGYFIAGKRQNTSP
jgi:hypothetical protein